MGETLAGGVETRARSRAAPQRRGCVCRSRGARPLIPLTTVTAPTSQQAARLVLGRAGEQRRPSEKAAPTRLVPGQLRSHRPGVGDLRDGDPRTEQAPGSPREPRAEFRDRDSAGRGSTVFTAEDGDSHG